MESFEDKVLQPTLDTFHKSMMARYADQSAIYFNKVMKNIEMWMHATENIDNSKALTEAIRELADSIPAKEEDIDDIDVVREDAISMVVDKERKNRGKHAELGGKGASKEDRIYRQWVEDAFKASRAAQYKEIKPKDKKSEYWQNKFDKELT